MVEAVNILFYACSDGAYEVRLQASWSRDTTSGKFVPPYTAKNTNTLLKKLENPESSDQELRNIGYRLFAALCGADTSTSLKKEAAEQSVQAALQNVIQRTLRKRGTVALALIFGPGCDEFVRYPWELLHNGDLHLILSGIFTLSRSLQLPDMSVGRQLPIQLPLRVLHIGSSPTDCVPLENEKSFQALEQALAPLTDAGQVFLDRLEPPTYSELVRYFNLYGGVGQLDDSDTKVPCYVVHFDGHGAYGRLCPRDSCKTMNTPDAKRCSKCTQPLARIDPQTYLCFCDEDNLNQFVSAETLRNLLVSSDIRLAVFSACDTAMVTNTSRARQQQKRAAIDTMLATTLMKAQVPAVVAMPFSLQDDLSPILIYHFYESLANGRTLEESLSRARQAMLSSHQKSWFVPVLYRLVAEGEEGPVALISRSDAIDEHAHPLAHLGPPSTFVGRTSELLDLDVLLEAAASGRQKADIPGRLQLRAGCRRIALTGYAGMGKSALAYEAIRRNRNKFSGGIIGISLREGKSFANALAEMLQALDIPIRNIATIDVKHRVQRVQTRLRSMIARQLPCLLLFDSFEEVKDHTELETWLQFICSLPPEVTVVVTSRSNPEHMAVVGSSHCRWYEYSVGKMTNEDLLSLFRELAATSGLDQRIKLEDTKQKAILRDICTLLEGYPLGAELIFGTARTIDGQIYTPEAATRSLEEVRDELYKTPLAGIWAVLDVSCRHLTPPARLLLSYLAAYKLPFTHRQVSMLVTPEALAMAPETLTSSQEIAQLVKRVIETGDATAAAALEKQWQIARGELVKASFIQFVEGNLYSIHSQIRQFALNRLPLEEQRRVHRVVAAYYCSLPQPDAYEWFEAFEHLEAAAEPRDLQEAVHIVIRAARALEGGGHDRELQVILRRASGYAVRLQDKTGEAEIQRCLGAILRLMGQYTEAEFCLKKSRDTHRQRDEDELAGWALYELIVLYCEMGDFKQAELYAQDALALFHQAHSIRGNAYMSMILGQISHGQGEYHAAQEHFNRALTAFVNLQDLAGQALTLGNRGRTQEVFGEYKEALRDYEEAQRFLSELKRPVDKAWIDVYKSVAYVQQGDLTRAVEVCNEAQAQFQQLGIQRGDGWIARVMGDISLKKQDLAHARSYYDRAAGLFISIGDLVDQALVFNALGQVSLAENEALDAQEYFEKARIIANKCKVKHIELEALHGLGEVEAALHQFATED